MRHQAGVAHHQVAAIPRGTVIIGLAVFSWLAVFSLWQLFNALSVALIG